MSRSMRRSMRRSVLRSAGCARDSQAMEVGHLSDLCELLLEGGRLPLHQPGSSARGAGRGAGLLLVERVVFANIGGNCQSFAPDIFEAASFHLRAHRAVPSLDRINEQIIIIATLQGIMGAINLISTFKLVSFIVKACFIASPTKITHKLFCSAPPCATQRDRPRYAARAETEMN